MVNPIHVVVPVTIDPDDPAIQVALRLDFQNYPATLDPNKTLSIVDGADQLRDFREIQAEFAKKSFDLTGSMAAAERRCGISRQTLTKWAAYKPE